MLVGSCDAKNLIVLEAHWLAAYFERTVCDLSEFVTTKGSYCGRCSCYHKPKMIEHFKTINYFRIVSTFRNDWRLKMNKFVWIWSFAHNLLMVNGTRDWLHRISMYWIHHLLKHCWRPVVLNSYHLSGPAELLSFWPWSSSSFSVYVSPSEWSSYANWKLPRHQVSVRYSLQSLSLKNHWRINKELFIYYLRAFSRGFYILPIYIFFFALMIWYTSD